MTPAEHIAEICEIMDTMASEGHFTDFGASVSAGAVEHALSDLLDSFAIDDQENK